MKICFKCKKKKPIEQFYVHKQMTDGHLGKCKLCAKKDVQSRYNNPESNKKIKEYERKRFQNPERKKKVLEYQRKRRAFHKGKYRANQIISNLIRNRKITRQPCEICGNQKSEAHHPDYRKPKYIRWLCMEHHRKCHRN